MRDPKVLLLVVAAACGGGGSAAPDAAVTPDAVACRHRVVLDFEGPSISLANADDATHNLSHLVHGSPSVVPKYRAADADRATKIAAITSQVQAALASYPIDVLAARPASGSYQLIVITETETDVGEPSQGELALYDPACPLDVTSPLAVGFVFEQTYPNQFSTPVQVANRVVQAIGSINRVPWTDVKGDCMCIDGDTACGTAACTIGGTLAGTGKCFASTGGSGTFNEAQAFGAFGCP